MKEEKSTHAQDKNAKKQPHRKNRKTMLINFSTISIKLTDKTGSNPLLKLLEAIKRACRKG